MINSIFKIVPITALLLSTILLLLLGLVQTDETQREHIDGQSENNELDIQALVDDAIDWAHFIGLIIHCKQRKHKSDLAEFVPFSLFPTPFPRKCYTQAKALQTAMNMLYFRISQDYDFLTQTLSEVAETNAIIRHHLNILKQVHQEGVKQPYTLLLGRSDYMCHTEEDNETKNYMLKQIEMNIGAIGGYGRAIRATRLHRRTMAKAGEQVPYSIMPQNNSEQLVVESLYRAWKNFGDPNAIFLIAVGQAYQTFEQKQLELLLRKMSNKRMKIVRLSLTECGEKLTLNENDFSLRLEGRIIGVVYFRTIIVTPNRDHINARSKIERSTAIVCSMTSSRRERYRLGFVGIPIPLLLSHSQKCPTVAMELASSKKVQQVLALPGTVEHFFPNEEDAETVAAIRSTFAGMWELDRDNADSAKIMDDAIKNSQNYVLKPSEEGGGNNFWGEKIAQKLRTFSKQQLSAHILMQRLKPLVVKNFLVWPLRPTKLVDVVSELSIFGTIIANGNVIEQNVEKGHMVRTKPEHVTEGGIGAGGGVHDSPYLF